MVTYKYIARDILGQRREGAKQAGCPNDVIAWLREQSFTPISVKETSGTNQKTSGKSNRKRVKSSDIAAVCWQLNTMLEGGIPVTTAMETIAEDAENLRLQQVLKQVLERIRKGESFSRSVLAFPNVFNRVFYAMILAGEADGNMPEALQRLAEYFEGRDKLAKKVKGAMAYPIFIFTFIVLIIVFIMAFIIPRFRAIFDQIGGQLPAFTRAFIAVYDVLRHNVVYIIGTVLLTAIFMVLVSRTKKGHYFLCKVVLGVPLLGVIISQAFVSMFCKTMAALLGAGVSVLEVFDILGTMTNNDVIKGAITQTQERIIEGSSISLGLGSSGFFPNMVVKMIQVGEESGSLAKVLEKTSDYYERKVDTTISTVMSLLEPIMIVTIGAIVLTVVIALYLPIFSMSSIAK
jgi:type II secretory pathway component PulF